MKVKVTYEKEFDSNEFYEGAPQEELDKLTHDQFVDGIIEYLCDWIDMDDFEFEEIKE